MGEYVLRDERVRWMRQRVTLALEMGVESFDEYFTSSAEHAKTLESYLQDSRYTAGSALFFSCNKWAEEVEVEEEIEIDVEEEPGGDESSVGPTGEEGAPPGDDAAAVSDESKSAAPVVSEEGGEKPAEDAAAAPAVAETVAAEAVAEEKKDGDAAPTPAAEGDAAAAPAEGADGDAASTAGSVGGPAAPRKKIVLVKRIEVRDRSVMFMGLEHLTAEMNDRPSVYFIKSVDGEIPKVGDADRAHGALNKAFEFGYLSGDVFFGIANLMHQVYAPVVARGTVADDASVASLGSQRSQAHANEGSGIDETLRHELSSSLNKFEQQLRHVVQTSKGDVRLTLPAINMVSPEVAADDPVQVDEIERALEDWTTVISAANEAEHLKVNRIKGTPLQEIDFWRERAASLSALYEQIMTPKVQQMLQVMKITDSAQLGSFNFHFGELSKIFLEAKDNVKFLITVERHFRHMTEGSFQTILESMQSMMNGLRMIWVISRHYNCEERMAPLMETIANTLVRRVREKVKLSEVLAMDSKAAKRLVIEARMVLTQWSENYFRMRKRLEDTNDQRWEFDRKPLFGKTDYMSEICANILEILEALDHFKVFLGPELKAVTGDAEGIDEVLTRVEGLSVPLQLPYEDKIFDRNFDKPWEAIMRRFRVSVAEIEKMTEVFIKESFRKLRSAEGAFELVQNFQKIGADDGQSGGQGLPPPPTAGGGQSKAGSSIKQQISNRYNDILEQYLHELDTIKQIFAAQKERPPLYKGYPPVAGSIAWARDLYQRTKRPILRFKNHGGLLDDEFGDKVKLAYLEFARAVDNFVAELYNDWEVTVAALATERLKQPVLRSIATYNAPTKQQEKEGAPFVLPPPPYRVSFAHDLKMIIKESRYLDKLGFRIPESALNVTLQESKYQSVARSLTTKLVLYDQLISSLKPIEKILLKAHIDDLNNTIKTGFYPLNWTSQRIPQYIEELNQALLRFSSIISQVHKNAQMIDDIINRVANTILVQGRDFQNADGSQMSIDISEFYEIVETRRIARLDALVQDYSSIGESFLMKVEEVVAKTATGHSFVLSLYYHYWEKRVYNAIAQMAIRSMAALMGLLQCKDSPPLFKVIVALNGNDMVVSPSLLEVDKLLTKAVRNMAESAKFFIRWMYGTCLKTEPQIVNEDEEPYIFSFFQDISKNPQVVKLTLTLTSQTNKVYNMTNKYPVNPT